MAYPFAHASFSNLWLVKLKKPAGVMHGEQEDVPTNGGLGVVLALGPY
jgi:hypothetical protein